MASVPNPVTISRANPLSFKFASYSVKPISRFGNQNKIPPHLFQTSGFRSCSSSSYSQSFPHSRWALFKDVGGTGTGNSLLNTDYYFRDSAASGGGSGGYGDSGGENSGGKGEGGDDDHYDDDDGRSHWSLLSWCMFLVEKYFVLKKAARSVLTLIGDVIFIPLNTIVHLSIVLVGIIFFCVILLALILPLTFQWFIS